MTYARRLLPDQTHSITRRVIERRFLLRPSPFVNAVILYSLARAKQLYSSVLLHAFVAESNHTHGNVTDTRESANQPSEVSKFFGSFHRMVAAALNTHYGRGENLWASGSFHNTEVHGEISTEQQLLYLWTNPVKDGLVERPEDWPGVIFLPEDFGTTRMVPKPEGAFFGGRRPGALTDPHTCHSWQAELVREEIEARALLASGPASPAKRRVRSKLPAEIELRIDPPLGYEHLLPPRRRWGRPPLDLMDTPANRDAMPKADHDAWPRVADVAETIAFLASPLNRATRGGLVPVYGLS